jgi:hypothetical protein
MTRPLFLALALSMGTAGAFAQVADPRLGEWRENHYVGAVGLYMIYEDLGDGITRTHTAENLAIANRLHDEARCDGNFYPRHNAAGEDTGMSVQCQILNARTVRTMLRNRGDGGWVEAEGTWILSDDGTHAVGSFIRRDGSGKVVEHITRLFTRNAERCLNHGDDAQFRACAQRTLPPHPAHASSEGLLTR